MPTCELATACALAPRNATLTWPLSRRKRKSESANRSVKVLEELEYGHRSVTIASIDLEDADSMVGES